MKFLTLPYIIKFVAIFLGYLITGKFGLEIGAVSGFATLVWLPTGLSLVALFLYGYRLWPAVFWGAFFVNTVTGAPFFVALSIALGNTLEALVGILLLRRVVFFRPNLQRLRDVIGLTIIVGPIIAAISATIGVLSLFLSETVLANAVVSTWVAWWTGDIISILIVAPLLFTWLTHPKIDMKNLLRVGEAAILMLSVIVSAFFVFTSNVPLTYLVFPPLIWAALRFGPRTTVTSVFIVSFLAIIYTSLGFGSFVRSGLSESLFYLQNFMSIVAVTSLILAAIVIESKSLEKRKDEFVSMASHELRTPITTIKIYLHLLMNRIEKNHDEKSVNILNNIDGTVDQLKDLVSDLLDISLIQANKLKLRKSDVIMADLINEVKEGLQNTTKKHKLLYTEEAPFVVHGDSFRIAQVLTNLLSNAIKYSPKGGDIIIRTEKRKNKLITSVQDFGIGFSKEEKEKVFDRLYQASYSEEKTFPGLGVGLYISKQIMKRHKENLWVESELHRGSTFYFSLPLVDGQT